MKWKVVLVSFVIHILYFCAMITHSFISISIIIRPGAYT